MRKFTLISLLLVSFLVDHQAQGARLIKGSSLAENHKVQEDKNDSNRSNNIGGVEEDQVNPSMERSSHDGSEEESGSNRKLTKNTLSTSSTTTATSKKDKNDDQGNDNKADRILDGQPSSERLLGGKEENLSVNYSSPLTDHRHPQETAPDQYPDILDIAGMDYSLAKRKTPIHN